MRQIFLSIPYFIPADPRPVRALFEKYGLKRRVAKGEILKRGGEDARLFMLTRGLCAYYVGAGTGKLSVLALILPGRAMGDLTASIGNRCNVVTRALENSEVLLLPPSILRDEISSTPGLAMLQIANVIAKEEAHIEGMVANFTLSPEARLKAFFRAAAEATGAKVDAEGWIQPKVYFPARIVSETINLNRVSVARLLSAWQKAGDAKRVGRALAFRMAFFDDLYDWTRDVDLPGPTLPLLHR